MIIVGFVGCGRMQALNLFDEICLKNNFVIKNSIDSKADIVSMGLKYSDFFAEKYEFIKFDILIFENCDIIKRNLGKRLTNSASNENILIVNFDDRDIFKNLTGIKAKLITYGLNSKSCITTSSIQDINGQLQQLQCCIQRTIFNLKNDTIVEQEFKVVIGNQYSSIYDSLAAISAAIVCGVELKSFEELIL